MNIALAVLALVALKILLDGTASPAARIARRHPANDPAWKRAAEKIRRRLAPPARSR